MRGWEEAGPGAQGGFGRRFQAAARAEGASLSGGLLPPREARSRDGTSKLLFELEAAPGSRVEAVLIPSVRRPGRPARATVCVSTQIGCAMGCRFCYTARMGLRRNLEAEHIVEQVLAARRAFAAQAAETSRGRGGGGGGGGGRLTNIVFMGMGEPLDNLESVLRAIEILTTSAPGVDALSPRKITVSTVGLAPQMREFVARSDAQLALSLHATDDATRSRLMPLNRKHDLSELRETLEDLFPRGRCSARRYVLIEYLLLAGVNDSAADADALLRFLDNVEAKVNLIQYNKPVVPEGGGESGPGAAPGVAGLEVEGLSGEPWELLTFQPTPQADMETFRDRVRAGGRVCTVRESRGDDEMAACGQLGEGGGRRPGGRAVRNAAPLRMPNKPSHSLRYSLDPPPHHHHLSRSCQRWREWVRGPAQPFVCRGVPHQPPPLPSPDCRERRSYIKVTNHRGYQPPRPRGFRAPSLYAPRSIGHLTFRRRIPYSRFRRWRKVA